MKVFKNEAGKKTDTRRLRMIIPVIVFLTGAGLMYAGIYRGEIEIVLRKAINICLECIGIG
jgi:hypothetical protein